MRATPRRAAGSREALAEPGKRRRRARRLLSDEAAKLEVGVLRLLDDFGAGAFEFVAGRGGDGDVAGEAHERVAVCEFAFAVVARPGGCGAGARSRGSRACRASSWSPSSRVMACSAWRWARLGAIGSATTETARCALVRLSSGARKRQPTSSIGQRSTQNVACQRRVGAHRSPTTRRPRAGLPRRARSPPRRLRLRGARGVGGRRGRRAWRIADGEQPWRERTDGADAGIGEGVRDEAQLVDDDRRRREVGRAGGGFALANLAATAAQRRSGPTRSTRGRARQRSDESISST